MALDDYVTVTETREVIFTGSPPEVVDFVKTIHRALRRYIYVVRGDNINKKFTAERYLVSRFQELRRERMFFDAVLDKSDDSVLYNSTPENVKKLLETFVARDKVYVMDGETLTRFTVEEYLKR